MPIAEGTKKNFETLRRAFEAETYILENTHT